MVPASRSPRRRARAVGVVSALSVVVTGAVVGSALLTGASADVLAAPASTTPVSQPQVVMVQRVERPVVLRAEKGSRLDAKGNDLFEVSALGSFDVPEAALRAYKRAAATTNEAHSSCQLPWTLLAAIGRVESDHGRYGGSVLGSDGLPRPAIRGVALNGVGPVAAIPDSDNGRFDGDKVWDRAVGPMQFIPTTWTGSGRDGDGDGVRNPNDIDDAALAAAGYLCPSSGSIKAAGAMEQAIFSYNHSDYYVALVMAFERGYRTGTFTIPSPPPPPEEPKQKRSGKRDRVADEPRKRDSKSRDSRSRDDKQRHDRPQEKPQREKQQPRKDADKPRGGSGSSKDTGPTKPTKPTKPPKPPADKTLVGTLAANGNGWKVGGQVVDFGAGLTAPAGFDWDGDKQVETYGAELEGLATAGQEVKVVLKGGTTLVVSLQGQSWG